MTAGERWARDELLTLRCRGFRPAAWWGFLVASFRRAAATRRERPALARQAHAWSAATLAGGHVVRRVARRSGVTVPSGGAWTAWSLAVTAMLDWHLGMVESPTGAPCARLRAADGVTLSRMALAPFLATARRGPRFSALVATAGATDLLDGRLARSGSGPTRLGRDFDTAADVAVKLAAARAGMRGGWLSPGAARLVAGCQLAGVAFVAATYFRTGRPPADDGFGPARWAAPALIAGLAVAPYGPRAGRRLTALASLAILLTTERSLASMCA